MEPKYNTKAELTSRLREVRKKAGDTQADCADKLAISRVYYNRIENSIAGSYPTIKFLEKFCDVYNINYEWLVSGLGPERISDEIFDTKEDNIPIQIDESIINNTKSYVALQTANLLKKETLEPADYYLYFQTASSLFEATFNMLNELKTCKENKTPFTRESAMEYQNEFTTIIGRVIYQQDMELRRLKQKNKK